MHNLDFMLQTLVNLALHYPQAGRTPAQLRILAEDWAEDLAAFPRDIVERAVKAHRRESPYFPTVADIWRRCEALRRGLEARREAERALPGRTLTRDEQNALNTDWYILCLNRKCLTTTIALTQINNYFFIKRAGYFIDRINAATSVCLK